MEDTTTPGERPVPSAQGDLGKTPLAHLLVYARDRSLCGSMEFTHADGRSSSALSLNAGMLTKARTSEPVAHLGRILLDLGHVTQEALDATRVTLTERGGLHGRILIEAGAITEAQLANALEIQLGLKIAYVFTLPPETTFAYFDNFDVLAAHGGEQALALDPLPVIWRGLCLMPPWEHVDAAIQRIEKAYLRARAGVNGATLEQFKFEPDVAEVAQSFLKGPVRVNEFTAGGTLTASTAQLLAYCLLITKQVEIVHGVEPARPSPEQAVAPPSVGTLKAAAAATPVAIRRLLGSPSGQFAAAKISAEMRAPAPAPAARAAPQPPDELAARRNEIAAMAAKIVKLNYFEMLGVKQAATAAESDAAFVSLARRWHPDRLPATLADQRDAITHVFGRMSEAQKTLTNPEKREQYMLLIKDGGATPEAQAYIARVVEATMTFQKAEFHLKRGDMAKAEALARAAHQGDPTQADYLALLAWAEAMRPENQARDATNARIAMLDRAIAISPRSARAHYYRGMLHKRQQTLHLAAADFRKAVELNPNEGDALREVRLLEVRKGAPQATASEPDAGRGGGLLSRLLKKP